jgi:hypothetical protein
VSIVHGGVKRSSSNKIKYIVKLYTRDVAEFRNIRERMKNRSMEFGTSKIPEFRKYRNSEFRNIPGVYRIFPNKRTSAFIFRLTFLNLKNAINSHFSFFFAL